MTRPRSPRTGGAPACGATARPAPGPPRSSPTRTMQPARRHRHGQHGRPVPSRLQPADAGLMTTTAPRPPASGASQPARLAADVAAAVSAFGAAVTPRLATRVGEPEDQMRGPLEGLLDATAASLGV